MTEFVAKLFSFTMDAIVSMCLIMIMIVAAAAFLTAIHWAIRRTCDFFLRKKKEKKN